MPFLIFDIETVPDESLWKSDPLTKAGKKRVKEEFAPLYAHRPIVIGYALVDDELNMQHLGFTASDDEAKLIGDFTRWMSTMQATLVTFNGRGFDVPVLALRALRHGIDQRYYTAAHRRRYDEENHLDLMSALTEGGTLGRAGFSLGMMSTIIGLPGKGADEDGSKVHGMYQKGEHAKIQLYAQSDVVRTAFLLYRYLLMRGRIEIDVYRRAALALLELCKERKLTNVLFGCDAKRLLLEAPAGA